MSERQESEAENREEPLKDKTGGFSGQQGYTSDFNDGQYANQDVADSGAIDDRAGSYEDAYRSPERDDAIDGQSPRDPVGRGEPSNNYTDGRDLQAEE
jgi:hypothetical protein